jgi:hypothetical protein
MALCLLLFFANAWPLVSSRSRQAEHTSNKSLPHARPLEVPVRDEDPDVEDAPSDAPADAQPTAVEAAQDEAIAVAGADVRWAERAGAPGLEPRRDAARVVRVPARSDERGRPGLQRLHAHRAVAHRDGR